MPPSRLAEERPSGGGAAPRCSRGCRRAPCAHLLPSRTPRRPDTRPGEHLQRRRRPVGSGESARTRHPAQEEPAVGVDRVSGGDALAELAVRRRQRDRLVLDVGERVFRRGPSPAARSRVHVAHEGRHRSRAPRPAATTRSSSARGSRSLPVTTTAISMIAQVSTSGPVISRSTRPVSALRRSCCGP